jgi:hypothetical protein
VECFGLQAQKERGASRHRGHIVADPVAFAQATMARMVWLFPVPPAPVRNIFRPVFTASSAAV